VAVVARLTAQVNHSCRHSPHQSMREGADLVQHPLLLVACLLVACHPRTQLHLAAAGRWGQEGQAEAQVHRMLALAAVQDAVGRRPGSVRQCLRQTAAGMLAWAAPEAEQRPRQIVRQRRAVREGRSQHQHQHQAQGVQHPHWPGLPVKAAAGPWPQTSRQAYRQGWVWRPRSLMCGARPPPAHRQARLPSCLSAAHLAARLG